jgi:hypothetical protein
MPGAPPGVGVGGGMQYGAAPAAAPAPQGPPPTCAIVMDNMVTIPELSDPSEYNDILLDVSEECGRWCDCSFFNSSMRRIHFNARIIDIGHWFVFSGLCARKSHD